LKRPEPGHRQHEGRQHGHQAMRDGEIEEPRQQG